MIAVICFYNSVLSERLAVGVYADDLLNMQ